LYTEGIFENLTVNFVSEMQVIGFGIQILIHHMNEICTILRRIKSELLRKIPVTLEKVVQKIYQKYRRIAEKGIKVIICVL